MAIKKATAEFVAQGSHRVKVSTIVKGNAGRKYQAQCRDCEWKGTTIGAGTAADREGLVHAKETVGQRQEAPSASSAA